MREMIVCFCAALVIAAFSCEPAYAWTVQQDNGATVTIKCADGSQAAVAKFTDNNGNPYWAATSAGTNGKTGGSFAIMGQAAEYACGE